MSYTCSDCFQTGPHESSVGESGSEYSVLKNYYNNYNNQPILLPFPWPQPPTPGAQRPFDAPDYFQNYTVRDGRPTAGYGNQFVSYPLPLGCNTNLNFTNLNPWTIEDVKAKLKQLNLILTEKHISKLANCLNCNYVYKYDHKLNQILAYYIQQL